ncbi:RusA family crossover junction endodeoxyribonuclease [Lysinibacillus sp. OL1_EC]|uniref:RusA family crossover junction endodeoxyribonuclease n=1 Tax=Lysinibacillus TaxID=400634 RepID=UPI00103B1977|nr:MULTISPECIES: RusA family crossover junction endodeoxyribonuclease [Lysinibacillus]MCM0625328.1 RusA family crossover junction endodeoxyribonuclease [Lysinibacillus sp. OL1_EC]MCS5500898.1 RusA family crossover junction endodeoxyribonuclease [Lysinibacillus sp. A4]TBV87145.1 RusA family crossover junction endodeoxyribonuclease [Lysinibacillus sp. OL1]UKJ44308.1 RusA family crossover junction endodeoxyribonuclease [Lysinibacillus sp. ACHW1.5]
MNVLTFEIPGDVQAQQRPRVTRNGTFDPKESKDYKSFVRLVAAEHAPESLITEDIKLTIDVYRKMPKAISNSKKKLQQALNGELRPTTKPDIDNLAKGIKDGLSKVIWRDDSQVTELVARKWYSDNPRAEVTIEWHQK